MSDFLLDIMESMGYFGIALLMLLENILPPIPSEVVMPAAGATARRGELSLAGVIIAGSIGSIAGALPWYYAGRWIGTKRVIDWADRHGHWLGTNPEEMRRADRWFDRRGQAAVFLCRLVPGLRTLISLPAGFAEMPLTPFLVYTSLGATLWTALLALLGWWLQDADKTIARITQWIGLAVIGLLLIWFIARIVRARIRKQHRTT